LLFNKSEKIKSSDVLFSKSEIVCSTFPLCNKSTDTNLRLVDFSLSFSCEERSNEIEVSLSLTLIIYDQ
jgi:hypothetical protein